MQKVFLLQKIRCQPYPLWCCLEHGMCTVQVRHVQEMFPHISTDIVAQDLASTQNVDATIENMLGLHHDT